MGKIALLFAGQGSQYPGMGKDIYDNNSAAREALDRLEKLRPGMLAQCWEGTKEELSVTVNTQPCMFAIDYAIAKAVESSGVEIGAVAGFSLGEIPALGFAGVLTEEEAFALVCKRAELMQQAAEKRIGGMQAVVKLTADRIETLAEAYDAVYPVNYNSPEQTAVAGDPDQLQHFAVDVKEAGGRAVPLAVSGAFHCPFMDSAAEGMKEYTQNLLAKDGHCTVYANCTGEPYSKETAADLIFNQVNHPVQWVKTIDRMQEDGITCFVEVGPGKTLSGLVKKNNPNAEVYKVENMEDLNSFLEAIGQ